MTELETILAAAVVAEAAVAAGIIISLRPSRRAFLHLEELAGGVRAELSEVKRENKELLEKVAELKTLVAVLIADSGTGGAERQRIVENAKARIASGKGAIDLIKEGKLMQALQTIAHEVPDDELDEVIQLTGRLSGVVRSFDRGRISEAHYETEMGKVRAAATELAMRRRRHG